MRALEYDDDEIEERANVLLDALEDISNEDPDLMFLILITAFRSYGIDTYGKKRFDTMLQEMKDYVDEN